MKVIKKGTIRVKMGCASILEIDSSDVFVDSYGNYSIFCPVCNYYESINWALLPDSFRKAAYERRLKR